MDRARVDASRIVDEDSFHRVFREALGDPKFVAGDMNAWIEGMIQWADRQGLVVIEVAKAIGFRSRCPALFAELVECTALVNHRFAEEGRSPPLALVFL
jgi:hypothetical protein